MSKTVSEETIITIHLGTGSEGKLRKKALEAIAATQGHIWHGKPSIGRWLVAQADQWLDDIHHAIESQKDE